MDFQKLVTDILETGMTQTELARRCGNGTTQGHISAIYTGRRRGDKIGYRLGDALVKIHRRAMRKKAGSGLAGIVCLDPVPVAAGGADCRGDHRGRG